MSLWTACGRVREMWEGESFFFVPVCSLSLKLKKVAACNVYFKCRQTKQTWTCLTVSRTAWKIAPVSLVLSVLFARLELWTFANEQYTRERFPNSESMRILISEFVSLLQLRIVMHNDSCCFDLKFALLALAVESTWKWNFIMEYSANKWSFTPWNLDPSKWFSFTRFPRPWASVVLSMHALSFRGMNRFGNTQTVAEPIFCAHLQHHEAFVGVFIRGNDPYLQSFAYMCLSKFVVLEFIYSSLIMNVHWGAKCRNGIVLFGRKWLSFNTICDWFFLVHRFQIKDEQSRS